MIVFDIESTSGRFFFGVFFGEKNLFLMLFLSLSPPGGRRPLDPLSWSEYFEQELYLENVHPTEIITHHLYISHPAAKGPLFVTHHGAGSTGLSFALFASEIRKLLPRAGVLSVDARGHGMTTVRRHESPTNGHPLDLSLSTLSHDLTDVLVLTQKQMAWDELPDLVFIGHSLGGAVITDVAMNGGLGKAVLGYAVLDVVEGTLTILQQLHLLSMHSSSLE